MPRSIVARTRPRPDPNICCGAPRMAYDFLTDAYCCRACGTSTRRHPQASALPLVQASELAGGPRRGRPRRVVQW